MTLPTPLSKRLKQDTHGVHDALDKRIMDGDPFRDRARYGRFLIVQHGFHREIEALYANPVLAALLPDLAERSRFALIEQDMADLGIAIPDYDTAPAFGSGAVDHGAALGWLYVAEGSNLGAAFLFKAARALSLDEGFGARHLAGHPDGRAQHWRSFTGALDGVELDEPMQDAAISGARRAFETVRALTDKAFA